jgi:hypothetical protein
MGFIYFLLRDCYLTLPWIPKYVPAKYCLCNGGSLYAPYSLLSISNMLCDASFLTWWGGGEQGGKVTLRPCFQGHNVLYGY